MLWKRFNVRRYEGAEGHVRTLFLNVKLFSPKTNEV